MFEEIIQLDGKNDGPTSIILAGVHGDEKCAIEALEKTLLNFSIENGRVFFGYGNPRAIEENKRFIEANLNRMFKDDKLLSVDERKSYEYKRAQFLKKYLDKSEALLDLHASHTPNSKHFIICEKNSREVVKYLPGDFIVSGFDALEPGGTDSYMNSNGKMGICMECGYIEDPESIKVAETGILAFLKARGHIANDEKVKKHTRIHFDYLYKTKTNNFILAKSFDDFAEISKGQLIGIDGGEEIIAERDAVILFARNRNKIGDEAFLLGKKLYK